jgi:hypothetical protein
MKRFSEMTREELVELSTNTEKRTIIEDLELAYTGVLRPCKPILQELPSTNIKPTVKAYQVGGHGGLIFMKKEDAEMVATLSIMNTEYIPNAGYNKKYLKPNDSVSISVESFYDEEELRSMASALKNEDNIKSYNEKVTKEYESSLEEVEDIINPINEAIHTAVRDQYRLDSAKKKYEEYLVLAEGNIDIAKNFFTKIYSNDELVMKEVLGNIV